MGRGNKNRKPPPPPKTATIQGGAAPPENQEHPKIDVLSSIEAECQAAIKADNLGNHAEALSLVNDICLRHESCSLVHAARSKLHALEASRTFSSDHVLSREHWRSAVGSARRAVSLLPNKIEFSALYDRALFELTCAPEDGFEEVLTDCERALSVENPLLHCTDASLSFKVKAVKEKSDAESSWSESEKYKMGLLRAYWNTMSDERKTEFMELRIADLKEYYYGLVSKNRSAETVFSEGVSYAEKTKTWKFWACYYCDEKFQDFELRLKHIEREHEGEIGQYLQLKRFLFKDVDGGGFEVCDNLLVNGDVYVNDMERIVLTGDDCFVRVVVEYGSASTCDAEVPFRPDIDGFTQWLFDVPPNSIAEEQAVGWLHLQDQTKHDGMELPKRFEEEFVRFEELCKKQRALVRRCRSLRAIEINLSQELLQRKQDENHVLERYKSVLKKMKEPQVHYAKEEDSMNPTEESQLEAILGVTKVAQKIRELNNTDSGSSTLTCIEFEDEEDASIRMAIKQNMQQQLTELCEKEALIARSNGVLWQLLIRYKQASLDYRDIMLNLMRNFILAKLEKENSDAAYAELFSEVSLDTKESTSKGNSDPKLSKNTSKDKKKNEHRREVKDSKVSNFRVLQASSSKQPTVEQEEKAEQAYAPNAEEAKSADTEVVEGRTEENLSNKVEWLRRKVFLKGKSECRCYIDALVELSQDVDGLDNVIRHCVQDFSVEHPTFLSWFRFTIDAEGPSDSPRSKSSEFTIDKSRNGDLKKNWQLKMNNMERIGFMERRISDMTTYCYKLRKDKSIICPAERVFFEAIDYAKNNQTWKFWACYYCDEKFHEFKARLKHIEQEHKGQIEQYLQLKPFLFPEVDADCSGSAVYGNLLANGTFYSNAMGSIILTGDSSCPLGDRLLRLEVGHGSASTLSIGEVAVQPDFDAFAEWLFDLPLTRPAKELAERWLELQEKLKRSGKELPSIFLKEFAQLQLLHGRQKKLVVECRSFRAMFIVCAKEFTKREKREQDGLVPQSQSYDSLLREMPNNYVHYAWEDSVSPTKESLVQAIVAVKREAKGIRDFQITKRAAENKEDATIRMAIHNKMKGPLFELCENEAQITRSKGSLYKLSLTYKQASLDYRAFMLYLMRDSILTKLAELDNQNELKILKETFKKIVGGED